MEIFLLVGLGFLRSASFSFKDLRKELTELWKTVILKIMAYHRKSIQIKISKGKGQSPEETKHTFPVVLS